MSNHRALHGAYTLFILQISVISALAVAACFLLSVIAGLSLICGGLVSVLPNLYFANKLFQYRGARNAKKIVKGFYQGEAMKMLLTIVLFAMVFKFVTIEPLVFFAGFIIAQLIFWAAPLLFKNK